MKLCFKTLLFIFFISLMLITCPLSSWAEKESYTQEKDIQILITDEGKQKKINVSIENIKERIINGETVVFVEKQEEEKKRIDLGWIINALKRGSSIKHVVSDVNYFSCLTTIIFPVSH